jgi:hypothetical protein
LENNFIYEDLQLFKKIMILLIRQKIWVKNLSIRRFYSKECNFRENEKEDVTKTKQTISDFYWLMEIVNIFVKLWKIELNINNDSKNG